MIDDNSALCDLVKKRLIKDYVVDIALNLREARYLLDIKTYDLLVLDLVLPDGSGDELCLYLKENKLTIPVIFLTGESGFDKKILCLQKGNDFLSKPFNMLELEARIKLLLEKKNSGADKTAKLELNNLQLNQLTHMAELNGQEIKLNRKEFSLLELFLQHPAQIFNKATLAEKIWQEDEVLFGNSIETTIAHLRRKLGKDVIKTVKGVGYGISSH